MNHPDELQLQRLTDGELSPAERQAFLAEADNHLEQWREIALAFIEEQRFSDEIPRKSKVVAWRKWMSAVACLALIFAAGLMMGRTMIPRNAVMASNTKEVPSSPLAYETNQLQDFLNQFEPTDQLKEAEAELRRRGYAVDWDTQFLSRRLDDGRKLIMPVSTVGLRYQGQ